MMKSALSVSLTPCANKQRPFLVNEVNGQGASASKWNPNGEQKHTETNDLVVGIYFFLPFSSRAYFRFHVKYFWVKKVLLKP